MTYTIRDFPPDELQRCTCRMAKQQKCRRVGIVGFGRLGQYLYEEASSHPALEVAFVWNRSSEKLQGAVPEDLILRDLADCATKSPDLIVEVAHPSVSAEYGVAFLQAADFMIGSPTALADAGVHKALTEAAKLTHGMYVPAGALWGAQDLQKMADRGTLKGLKVTMSKHPFSFKLCGSLAEKVKTVKDEPMTLYEGPVRDLCPLAPNNVNTMACAAIAAHNLGFEGVVGCIVADPSLSSHLVEIDVLGPGPVGSSFSVRTVRNNPATTGQVTGKQTYASFLSSLLATKNGGPGIHLC